MTNWRVMPHPYGTMVLAPTDGNQIAVLPDEGVALALIREHNACINTMESKLEVSSQQVTQLTRQYVDAKSELRDASMADDERSDLWVAERNVLTDRLTALRRDINKTHEELTAYMADMQGLLNQMGADTLLEAKLLIDKLYDAAGTKVRDLDQVLAALEPCTAPDTAPPETTYDGGRGRFVRKTARRSADVGFDLHTVSHAQVPTVWAGKDIKQAVDFKDAPDGGEYCEATWQDFEIVDRMGGQYVLGRNADGKCAVFHAHDVQPVAVVTAVPDWVPEPWHDVIRELYDLGWALVPEGETGDWSWQTSNTPPSVNYLMQASGDEAGPGYRGTNHGGRRDRHCGIDGSQVCAVWCKR